MIVVVDYGRGNIFSLSHALRKIGVDHVVSEKPEDVEAADMVILPGVGAFKDAAEGLRARGLFDPIRDYALRNRPFLGICVGYQLLMSVGTEFGECDGLGVIPGVVRRLSDVVDTQPAGSMKIPNVGWRPVRPTSGAEGAGLWAGPLDPGEMMYFVHSFLPCPKESGDVHAAMTFNGVSVPVAVKRGNVMGVQFHPERSGPHGLKALAGLLGAHR